MTALVELRPEDFTDTALIFELCPTQMGRRIRAAAAAAGLAGDYNTHSPRLGMIRDMAAAGLEVRPQAPVDRGAVARYYRST